MSNRPSFSRSSSMIVHVGDPSPDFRTPSQRPSNILRTPSYHGPGSTQGTRISEHPRPSLQQTRRNSARMLLSGRASTAVLDDVSNRATAGSARTAQSSYTPQNNRIGLRGTLARQHQILQQTANRNPQGHRTEFHRTEYTNVPQYRYSNSRGRLPAVAPIQRSQYRLSAAAYNGRNGRFPEESGTEYARESQSLVRVGGRVVHPRRLA